MENAMDSVKLAELKKESLRKSFDQAHAQSSSILLFTLQWKDLEDQFELTQNSLLKQAQDLDMQEKKLVETAQLLEQRSQEVEIKLRRAEERVEELQMNEKQLGLVKKWIQECDLELSSKEKQLNLAQKEVEDCNEKLSVKEKQLGLVQKQLEECNKDLSMKKEQLGKVQNLIEECSEELEAREKKLGLVKVKLEDCCMELDVKDQQLESVQKSLQVCSKELETKEKEVEKLKFLATDCNDELKLRGKELDMLKNLISDCNGELELKQKQLEPLKELTEKCSGELDLKARKLGRIEKSIDQCVKDLDLKKKELDATQKLFQDRLDELNLKEKELSRVQKLIGENSRDLDLKGKHLDSIKVLIGENIEELEAKEKRYDAINKSINECTAKLTLKEAELKLIEKSVRECSSKVHSEEKKLDSVQKYAKKCAKELESKEKNLNSIKETIKTYCADLKLKEREFDAIRESIGKQNEELKLKDELLKSVQISIKECNEELEAMKKQQNSVQNSIMECSEELESKRKNLDLVGNSLKECCDNLVLKEAELDSVQKRTCGFCKELEEKEKYFDSFKRTLEKRLDKLEIKKRQFEERVQEFELNKQQFDSMQQSVEEHRKQVELKEKQLNDNVYSQATVVQPENLMTNNTINSLSAGFQSCITNNGKALQLLLNEHLRKHDLVHNEVFTTIQKSPDPGKLVLDAMQGFYPLDLEKGDEKFDVSVIRRSCTTLLEQLLKISPLIKPEIRKEAMELASGWKARMGEQSENSLEVLGFLHLLAAFKLTSAFSPDELQRLLETVSQHRQAPELQQALRIAENVPGSDIFSSHVKIEQMEHLHASDPLYSSSANFQSGVTIDERSCPLALHEDMGEQDLRPHEVLTALKLSSDPAKFVLDMMLGSYSQHWKNEGTGLDTSVARSKVLLLEQLMKVSPKINPWVREEALKIAMFWKANIRLDTQNKMEVWAFLMLLAVYGLVSYFGGDEILGLVGTVAHFRQAPEICQILGFAAVIPRFIQNLLQKQQYIEAVRFSCAFGLVYNFPLESILQKYMENIKMAAWNSKNGMDFLKPQDEAIDKQVGGLRAILECIADYKLESRFSHWNIPGRIAELEKLKASSRGSSAAPALIVQSQLQGGNHHPIGISGPKDHQPPPPAPVVQPQLYNQNNLRDGLQLQGNNKRPRTDFPVDRPYSSHFASKSAYK